MPDTSTLLNPEVSTWIQKLNHSQEAEINKLRTIIIGCRNEIQENIKWNSPNYSCAGQDRITLRIQPVKNFQIILHRGASKNNSISAKPIEDASPLLEWKSEDRAVISLNTNKEFDDIRPEIERIIAKWLLAP